MNTLVHNLNIRYDSWHARWYRHWVSLGGKPAAYRENLCRYVWVLLIRAPLRWFFKDRITLYVPPWAATLAGSFFAFIGVAFYLWPEISLEVLWKASAVIGGIITFVAVVLGIAYLYDRDPETTKKLAKWLTSPIWAIPFLVFLLGRWVYRRFEDQFQAVGEWFVERSYFFGVTPSGATLILLTLVLFSMLMYASWWKTLIGLGGIITVACVVIGLVIIGEKMKKRQMAKDCLIKPQTRLGRAYEGVADTVKLGATYVSTKKKGSFICPLLNLEAPPQAR